MWPGKLRPENFVDTYNVSKTIKIERRFGPVLLNPTIYLNIWRNKLLQAEDALRARKERHEKEKEELLVRWQEIEKNGEDIQSNFLLFNKFMIANLQKRKRAAGALHHNKELVRQHVDGICDLKRNIETVQEMMKNIEEGLHDHRMYERYLQQVLEASDSEDQFKNVDSIVERYEYFAEIAMDLMQKQEKAFDILQNVRMEWLRSEEINANVILGLRTQLAGLQGRFDLATEKTHRLENLIRRIKDATFGNYRDIETTTSSIFNLYRLICKTKCVPLKIRKNDVENQLIFISQSLKQYAYINAEMRAILNKNAKKINKK